MQQFLKKIYIFFIFSICCIGKLSSFSTVFRNSGIRNAVKIHNITKSPISMSQRFNSTNKKILDLKDKVTYALNERNAFGRKVGEPELKFDALPDNEKDLEKLYQSLNHDMQQYVKDFRSKKLQQERFNEENWEAALERTVEAKPKFVKYINGDNALLAATGLLGGTVAYDIYHRIKRIEQLEQETEKIKERKAVSAKEIKSIKQDDKESINKLSEKLEHARAELEAAIENRESFEKIADLRDDVLLLQEVLYEQSVRIYGDYGYGNNYLQDLLEQKNQNKPSFKNIVTGLIPYEFNRLLYTVGAYAAKPFSYGNNLIKNYTNVDLYNLGQRLLRVPGATYESVMTMLKRIVAGRQKQQVPQESEPIKPLV